MRDHKHEKIKNKNMLRKRYIKRGFHAGLAIGSTGVFLASHWPNKAPHRTHREALQMPYWLHIQYVALT